MEYSVNTCQQPCARNVTPQTTISALKFIKWWQMLYFLIYSTEYNVSNREYSAVGRQRSTWNLFLDKNISTFHTYSINRADGHFNLRHIKNLILIPKQDIGLLRKKSIRFIIDATARLSNATDWVPSCKPDFQYTWGCYCFSVYVTITNKYYFSYYINVWKSVYM
jgi:hypothetical protein